jgi:hypothetical protein
MADLKPIGSEKLTGTDKLKRIMEIATYKEHLPQSVNENSSDSYNITLADGLNYAIVKEKNGYVIKKGLNESIDYMEPMKNRKYYSSYSQAFKRLNLIAKEVNTLFENEENVNLFNNTISEQEKKFVLKTPKPEPAPAPEPSMDAPMDDAGVEDMGFDAEMDMDTPEGDIDMDIDMDAEVEPSAEEDVDFKQIQKLTGKLGQKIRTMNDTVGMTSEDIKYVLNSLISALDLEKLDEEDKEDVLNKLEGEEIDYGMDDSDNLDISADDELDMDVDMDVDMEEPEMGENFLGRMATGYVASKLSEEEPKEEMEPSHDNRVSEIMDSIFNESVVDKVLSSYFKENDTEKRLKEEKTAKKFIQSKIVKKTVMEEVKKLSETVEQELASDFILKENPQFIFLGKTNKGNLVFEYKGEKLKVSTKGEIL